MKRVCAFKLLVNTQVYPALIRVTSDMVFLSLSSLCLCRTGSALLEDDNTFHMVRPTDEMDEVSKSKRGSMKDKAMTKAITEIYLTRLLAVKVTTSFSFIS